MEPLAAVALAGNVLQFIEFVGRLLKDASKIYVSASGLTPEDLHIQDICGKLGSFSVQLQSMPSSPNAHSDKHLRDCAAACKKDCDDLFNIMMAVAAKGNSRTYWKSFSAALSQRLKAGEIQGLRNRIEKSQHFIERVREMNHEVLQLRSTIKDWTTRATVWFDRLSHTQWCLSQQIQTLIRDKSIPQNAIENICSGLRGLSIDTRECQQTMDILHSLDYQERPIRHSVIPEAHQTTFAWALRQDEPGESHGDSGSFHRWLRGGSDLFWVSGKPGSGKSTFMKFAAGHKETPECLRQWAGNGELVLAKHFFTIYGTAIQRSLEGLVRSLLHSILEGQPKLMKELLPARWATTSKQPIWTPSELESTLRAVANTDLPAHICFFIDGLDEYSGDHLDICQTLKGLSQSPFIKVCVSSRPWNVFEDAFGSSRRSKLYMHELTYEDILRYTQARLEEHPRWSFFSSGSKAAASQSLVNEVVDKSMGVFLWVFLVTRLLREGLNNDDSFSDLRRRVSSYPEDLEKFFKHILASVEPFYHEKMAGTLMIALDAGAPLATEMFMFHDHEYDDQSYALHDPADDEWADFGDCKQASSSVPRRINGRCKGLLEWQRGRMVFLHRTVFDFLRTPEMVRFLREKTKASFCSHLSLLRAWLAWLKRTVFEPGPFAGGEPDLMQDMPDLVRSLRRGAQYARLASNEGGDTAVAAAALLDNAELCLINMVRADQIPTQDESTVVGVYRLLLLESGIGGYVDNKLSIPGYLSNSYAEKHHSPLCFVLGMAPGASDSAEVNRGLLERLLELGHDPNKVYDDDTFWTRLVKFYTCGVEKSPPVMLDMALESGILETLLRHGADPTAYISHTPEKKIPFWFHLLVLCSCIKLHHQPAFKRVWDFTLEHVHVLSQATLLKKAHILSAGNVWASYELWGVMQREMPVQEPLEELQDDFLLGLFATTLEQVRENRTAFAKCRVRFAELLGVDSYELGRMLALNKREVNSKKLLKQTRPEGSPR
ncbi:hypothetical protein ACHAPT_003221 [Fusarium lateritium]